MSKFFKRLIFCICGFFTLFAIYQLQFYIPVKTNYLSIWASFWGETPYIDVSLEDVDTVLKVSKNYSSFRYRKPYFIDDNSKTLFYKRDWNNEVLDNVQTSDTFFGEVHVVKNGLVDGYHYCGYKRTFNWLKVAGDEKPKKWFHVLVPLTLTDGGTFQHFQDQVLLRLLQVLPMVRAYNATLLMFAPRDKILFDLYEKWQISSQVIFYKPQELYGADYVIHSCIRDSLHPMVWRESRRVTGVTIQRQIPIHSAYVIVLTRAGCFHCGRQILNHNKTVAMLETRYGKDLVKVFSGPQSLTYSLDLFGKARIIIGPHGGGFYNIIYAPEKTAIVEFMPTTADGQTGIPGEQIFFKISSILNQDYWRVAVPPEEKNNMMIDIRLLEELLNKVDEMQSYRR